ncbi:hypothetical protein JD844_007903 [Phrynosoma platyrhinos]|uniref:Ribosomal protein L35 n=1 Tax=Phrynosoma platyrhinos TaxID=52577 RepID=A0ABQ7T407_PHRPL|nr:hypothetical protein JD844_007903 [Phrynosoma platyrhinos]
MRKKVTVRKKMVMRMRKLRAPQANGQLRTMRMTTSILRSRKLMKTIREQSDLKHTHNFF